MIENTQNVLNPIFLLLQDPELNLHRMKHLIETIRNICFEYEKYEKDFVQMNMIELICRVLVKEHGLTEHSLPKSFQNLKDIAKKEKFIPDVD